MMIDVYIAFKSIKFKHLFTWWFFNWKITKIYANKYEQFHSKSIINMDVQGYQPGLMELGMYWSTVGWLSDGGKLIDMLVR